MIRPAVLGVAALVAAPALAAEGGPIRGGEHVGFSRIVMTIEPTTEWSLESGEGRATVFFPAKRLDFATGGTFELLPRTRITAVEASAGDAGTTVEITLGCDCRVSTAFVGARYLALDVADRDRAAEAAREPTAAEVAGEEAGEKAGPAKEDPKARAARETAAVASAEKVLIEQIERAASQGLIQLSVDQPASDDPPVAGPVAPEPAVAAPEPPSPPAAQAEAPAELPVSAAQPRPGALAGLLDHDQIQATTVYDRDSRQARARMAAAAIPPVCLPDDRLDIGAWSNGLPMIAQLPGLRRQLVGEFDAPDPDGVRALAQLYIRFGFGAEAGMLLADFPAELEDSALLADLARAVEGTPVTPDGPLAYSGVCPGRHALWLALGGVAPAFHDAESFVGVQAAFAELPTDLRALLGPGFVGRLLDAGHPGEARVVYDTAIRPGTVLSDGLQLAEARLMAAEGKPREGMQALSALIEGGAPNSVEALTYLARLAIDGGLPVPDRVITDLRAAALQYRGSEREPELRSLLAEALARRAELPAAIDEIRAARADLPEASGFEPLAVEILAAADPTAVGPAGYAETVLGSVDLIAAAPANDLARRTIAGHLVDLGLPTAALDLLGPALGRDDVPARLLAARAHLRLGEGAQARLALEDLDGPEAAELRARAFAFNGNFSDAVTTLAGSGQDAAAAPYAWPSGDWPRARAAAEDPERVAMASYMLARTGGDAPAPSADPAALAPDQAFQEPLPQLANPSLEAARRLLAAGPQVEGFVKGVLAEQ